MDYNITYREKDKGIQLIISYKDHNGKWKQKSKQGFKKKSEAKKYSDKMLDELKERYDNNINIHSDYENITFTQFSKIYIEHLKLHKETNTILLYELAIKHFSSLDNIKIRNITSLDIQICVDNLIKKHLKYSSINTYLARIKVIFKAAVDKYNIITSSPVNNISIKTNKEKNEKRALTKNELDDLIIKTKNIKYKVLFSLAGTCGLRLGEILGLTWDCVNFEDCLLTINKQWKNITPGVRGFGELKSKNSYRVVPIPSDTLELLQEFKKLSSTDKHNRVIPYSQIQGLTPLLKNYLGKMGFDITIHELRHTYATMLISNGIDFKTAAKLLGHDIEQTMKTYSHVTDDMLLNATNLINKIF